MSEQNQTAPATESAEIAEKRAKIERLVKRLRRSDPLRQIVADTLNNVPLSPEVLDRLLAMANEPSDSRWRERATAAWALGEHTLHADQALVVAQRLGRMLENKQIGKLNPLVRRLFRAGVALIVYAYWLCCYGFSLFLACFDRNDWLSHFILSNPWVGNLLYMLALGIPFVPIFSLIVDARRNNFVRAMAAWSLGRLDVPESIESLARTTVTLSTSDDVFIEASRALERVLPHVGDEHYGQMGGRTVPDLSELLFYSSVSRSLRLRILEVLEKIGDARAIVPLERFLTYNDTPQVKQVAERLLSILRERQRQESEPKVLLRASCAAEDTNGDMLLRAASGVSVTDPQQLLRATLNGEPGDESGGQDCD